MNRSRILARWACALAVTGLAGAAALGATAAAFTDHADLNLGAGSAGTAIGNPKRFDIAVLDQGGTQRDAAAEAAAVVLRTTGSTVFTEETPVTFTATVVNRSSSVTGDVALDLFDPDPLADDLFDSLRFSVYLGGSSTAAISAATAQQVSDTPPVLAGLAPGQSRTVRVDAVLAPSLGLAAAGKSTAIGLRGTGETS